MYRNNELEIQQEFKHSLLCKRITAMSNKIYVPLTW